MKVSVVIPVYNTARELTRCLGSVLGQTVRDLEVLCVDDGSTDGSAAILDAFAARDRRLSVLHQPNAGQAAARNRALDAASGDAILFVDADDALHPRHIERLLAALEATGADIAANRGVAEMATFDVPARLPDAPRVTRCDGALKHLVRDRRLYSTVWNKLFRAPLLRNLRFRQPSHYFEDWPFLVKAFAAARAYARIDEPLYFYNRESLTDRSTVRGGFTAAKAQGYLVGIRDVTETFRGRAEESHARRRAAVAAKMLVSKTRRLAPDVRRLASDGLSALFADGLLSPRDLDLKTRLRLWRMAKTGLTGLREDSQNLNRVDFSRVERAETCSVSSSSSSSTCSTRLKPTRLNPVSKFFLFRNAAGRVLKVLSEDLVRDNPELAAALSPVPLADLAPFRCAAPVPAATEPDARAWIFYPNRRDEVVTVFGVTDGAWWVEKRVGRRARRPATERYTQLALPRTPIWRGRAVLPPGRTVPDAALADYFTRLFAAFPPRNGLLPDNAVDAVPRNCLVEEPDGATRFFDLEYACRGGVRATFLVYRALRVDVLGRLPRRERHGRLRPLYEDWCRRLGLAPDFSADAREASAFKRFLSGGPRRRLAVALLSLVPSRTLRDRLAHWSDKPLIPKP